MSRLSLARLSLARFSLARGFRHSLVFPHHLSSHKLEHTKIQNTQEINKKKQRFLIVGNRTKRAHFRESPLFQAMYNIKRKTQTINSTYLVSVRCGRLAEGKGHETN